MTEPEHLKSLRLDLRRLVNAGALAFEDVDGPELVRRGWALEDAGQLTPTQSGMKASVQWDALAEIEAMDAWRP